MAGNAIETARLLLLSASSKFPQGLGNSTGQVGRNYCHHITGFVWGIFNKPVYSWRGAALAGVIEDEVANDPRRGFVGGYRLEVVTLDLPTFPLVGSLYAFEESTLSSQVEGRVAEVLADVGDSVKEGQALITLDPQELQFEVDRQRGLVTQVRAHLGIGPKDPPPSDPKKLARSCAMGRRATRLLGRARSAVRRPTTIKLRTLC